MPSPVGPPGAPPLRLRTQGYAHHSLKFSPYFEDRLALASGANFGLVGNGRVHVVRAGPGGVGVEKFFDTQDSVYDVAWNEAHENQLVAGCGNGAIRLFDITLQGLPVAAWHEHTGEVVGVDWSNLEKSLFATASWDGSVKVWAVERATALQSLPINAGQVYAALFSPHTPGLLATAGQDGQVRLFDLRSAARAGPPRPTTAFAASPADILAADWNKYRPGVIATAGKDKVVRVWDIRNPGVPTAELPGHSLAIRKIQWSPYHADIIASSGYDMTARIWNTALPAPRPASATSHHSEFTMALGWALFDEGVIATAGWDQELHLYRPVL
ncbi:Peroxisome biogenesis protein 7 [Vanrija pseudolonga]|uniref:Peroxin-7 n=1 Tax=Vanrija pseudolonga TaxID=143232 RepID=A0AAF1BR97_9TREE|nr:Peroxisome biogenesis protein 7 [Vanrija pseudolonga]